MVAHPVEASVSLIGITCPIDSSINDHMDTVANNTASIAEFAGRNCYQSFHKPNQSTRSQSAYIKNIISQRHFSVIEHIQASFYLTGVSRNFTHELVRHRHFSFSELSGRYVNPIDNDLGYIVPPAVADDPVICEILDAQFGNAETAYNKILDLLEEKGVKGKRAREAARSVMPGSIETRIVVSGNMRSWMEFVSKRDHPAADAEMRIVARMIYDLLSIEVPEIFRSDVREEWDESFSQKPNGAMDLGNGNVIFQDPVTENSSHNPSIGQ